MISTIDIYNNKINNKTNNKICNFENCNKKIRITDIECKCKLIFCKLHRLPEYHNCSYNFNSDELKRKIINSLECKGSKITKI